MLPFQKGSIGDEPTLAQMRAVTVIRHERYTLHIRLSPAHRPNTIRRDMAQLQKGC